MKAVTLSIGDGREVEAFNKLLREYYDVITLKPKTTEKTSELVDQLPAMREFFKSHKLVVDKVGDEITDNFNADVAIAAKDLTDGGRDD